MKSTPAQRRANTKARAKTQMRRTAILLRLHGEAEFGAWLSAARTADAVSRAATVAVQEEAAASDRLWEKQPEAWRKMEELRQANPAAWEAYLAVEKRRRQLSCGPSRERAWLGVRGMRWAPPGGAGA